jgi:hypothetical protein
MANMGETMACLRPRLSDTEKPYFADSQEAWARRRLSGGRHQRCPAIAHC